MLTDLLTNIGSVVVFVFDVTENFFNKVFKLTMPEVPPNSIHIHGNGLFLLHKQLHQFMGRHRFRHNGNFFHMIAPIFRATKHFGRMNVSHHIVYITIIDNYFDIPDSTNRPLSSSRDVSSATATTSVRGTIQSRILTAEKSSAF